MAAALTPQPLDPLLLNHKAAITELRAALGTELPDYWDDIWLLRFCLSFSGFAERLSAVRSCISYRERNAALLADAAAGRPAPHDDLIRPHIVEGFHGASVHGEPLYIVRAGLSNPLSKVTSVHAAYIHEWLMYHKERGQWYRDLSSCLETCILPAACSLHSMRR